VKDDGKTHASRDHGGADQRKIYCALINGKGENVGYGLHMCFLIFLVWFGFSYVSAPAFCLCEIIFYSKINLWIHPPAQYFRGSSDCHALNYTIPLQSVNTLYLFIFLGPIAFSMPNHNI
jgi:hypothetical protein